MSSNLFLLTTVLGIMYSPHMVENIDIGAVVEKLTAEFDALIDERREINEKSAKLQTRADEIDRKLSGIQKTLQGLALYTSAQEAPTELMKKTTMTIAEVMKSMGSALDRGIQVAGPDVQKTLSECCRDILRQKKDWMSPVQVRESLLAAGFDFSNYTSNPLSSIHTTLKRLTADEVESEMRTEGQVYRWIKKETLTPGEAKRMMENLRPKSGGKLADYSAAGRALAELEADKKK